MAVGFLPYPWMLVCLPRIQQCLPHLHGMLSPERKPSSGLCLWQGKMNPFLSSELRCDLARRDYMGKT